MKLLNFHFIKGPHVHPLEGFHQRFHPNDDSIGTTSPICLAGVNGSGKSKLLEILIEIFFYLDDFFSSFSNENEQTELQFEIEYVLEKPFKHIKIIQNKNKGIPTVYVKKSDSWEVVLNHTDVNTLLPKNIVGYSSGNNETLSRRFLETYMNYSNAVTNLTKKPGEKVPDTRLLLLDNTVNFFVFIANNIFRSSTEIKLLHNKIKVLDSLESFRISIQLKPRYKNRLIPINVTAELNKYIGALKKCSTSHFYDERNDKWVLDFYVNEITKKLFKLYFKDAFDFYTSLYKLELLNEILLSREKKEIIKEAEYPNQKYTMPELSPDEKVFFLENVRINVKGAKEDIGYFDLSDGEHQLLHVIGSLLMIDSPDVLFLLDEPETHFNPQWKAEFISTLAQLNHSKFQEFIITTHSPFLLSDSKRENVLIFKDGTANHPGRQTYGLSIERMLEEAFEVTMSQKAFKEIQKLQKETSSEQIEQRLDDFGESIEKIYLYERLEELKEEEKD